MQVANITFIEPYDGGSHKAFRTGLIARSGHQWDSLTLPPRFWKWRMRGAAAWFADLINERQAEAPDLFFMTGFLNVADFRGLLDPPLDRVPICLYMHENQLTYPLSPDEEFDFHFGFTNIVSCLAADRIIFNSTFHRELFLDSLPAYLGKMPEGVARKVPERLRSRSQVLGVGLERLPMDPEHYSQYRGGPSEPDTGPGWPRTGKRPLIIWNHRWEFDKHPARFARSIEALLAKGLDFEVAILGESKTHDAIFTPLAELLGSRLRAFGFLDSRAEYDDLLEQGDIIVSCAEQEYFGISVAEAVHAGCYPVLPQGQVYPSTYGQWCKGRHFYNTDDELVDLLTDLIAGGTCGHICSLDLDVDQFCWDNLAPHYDQLLLDIIATGLVPKGKATSK